MKRVLLTLLFAAIATSLLGGCESLSSSKPYDEGGWVGVPN